MNIVIIDYGSGNLHSAAKAVERAGRETDVAANVIVTNELDQVRKADRIVLPGVGAFADCYQGLASLDGMIEALEEVVLRKQRPFMGICVGMQLLAQRGFEHGEHKGLGWVEGEVIALKPSGPEFKIPHMGWNELTDIADHPVMDGLGKGQYSHAYFDHSYQFSLPSGTQPLALTDHGGPVVAAIGRDNIVGTQFHPEKSQATGLRLISNFLRWSL